MGCCRCCLLLLFNIWVDKLEADLSDIAMHVDRAFVLVVVTVSEDLAMLCISGVFLVLDHRLALRQLLESNGTMISREIYFPNKLVRLSVGGGDD